MEPENSRLWKDFLQTLKGIKAPSKTLYKYDDIESYDCLSTDLAYLLNPEVLVEEDILPVSIQTKRGVSKGEVDKVPSVDDQMNVAIDEPEVLKHEGRKETGTDLREADDVVVVTDSSDDDAGDVVRGRAVNDMRNTEKIVPEYTDTRKIAEEYEKELICKVERKEVEGDLEEVKEEENEDHGRCGEFKDEAEDCGIQDSSPDVHSIASFENNEILDSEPDKLDFELHKVKEETHNKFEKSEQSVEKKEESEEEELEDCDQLTEHSRRKTSFDMMDENIEAKIKMEWRSGEINDAGYRTAEKQESDTLKETAYEKQEERSTDETFDDSGVVAGETGYLVDSSEEYDVNDLEMTEEETETDTKEVTEKDPKRHDGLDHDLAGDWIDPDEAGDVVKGRAVNDMRKSEKIVPEYTDTRKMTEEYEKELLCKAERKEVEEDLEEVKEEEMKWRSGEVNVAGYRTTEKQESDTLKETAYEKREERSTDETFDDSGVVAGETGDLVDSSEEDDVNDLEIMEEETETDTKEVTDKHPKRHDGLDQDLPTTTVPYEHTNSRKRRSEENTLDEVKRKLTREESFQFKRNRPQNLVPVSSFVVASNPDARGRPVFPTEGKEKPLNRPQRRVNDKSKSVCQWNLTMFTEYFDFKKYVKELKLSVSETDDKLIKGVYHHYNQALISLKGVALEHIGRTHLKESDTRILFDGLLMRVCQKHDVGLQTETNFKLSSIPSGKFDYLLTTRSGTPFGCIETKSPSGMDTKAFVQAVLQLCSLQQIANKYGTNIESTPVFSILTDSLRFVFIQLVGREMRLEQEIKSSKGRLFRQEKRVLQIRYLEKEGDFTEVIGRISEVMEMSLKLIH